MIGSDGTGPHPIAGVLFGLATSATYACFLLILRHAAGQTYHPAGQLFDATAGAAAGALVLGLAFGGLQLTVPWRSLIWLLMLTLTSGIIGWLLIARSLPQLSATVSALILLLEPAGALVLAAIVLGQRPSPLQMSGAVLVCGGVLIVARSQSRSHEPGAVQHRSTATVLTSTSPAGKRGSSHSRASILGSGYREHRLAAPDAPVGHDVEALLSAH
jgi:drug/metabolite transporter (DMT)-like permease